MASKIKNYPEVPADDMGQLVAEMATKGKPVVIVYMESDTSREVHYLTNVTSDAHVASMLSHIVKGIN